MNRLTVNPIHRDHDDAIGVSVDIGTIIILGA